MPRSLRGEGDPASRLLARLRLCSTPACIVEALSDHADLYGPGAVREALRDPRVARTIAAACIDPEALDSLTPRANPEALAALREALARLDCRSLPPPPEALLREARERLVAGLETCRTTDCMLVRLAGLVLWMRPLAVYGGWSIARALEHLLRDPQVRRLAARLQGDPPWVLARSDPRHRTLRPLAGVIEAHAPPPQPAPGREEPLDVDVEWEPVVAVEPPPPPPEPGPAAAAPRRPRRRGRGRLVLLAAALVVAVLYAIAGPGPLGSLVERAGGVVEEASRSVGEAVESLGPEPFNATEARLAVLEAINRERARAGVPPVKIVDLGVAQYRAGDMAARGYYGHCDLEGRHPGYYYTLLGGVYSFEENIGVTSYVEPLDASDYEELVSLVEAMVYDDAHAGWLHRDSLLDPTNNAVDIGVAEGQGYLFLVIHMQKAWVDWITPPSYDPETGLFTAEGRLLLNGSSIYGVIVYRAGYDHSRLYDSPLCGSKLTCTCGSYSIGDPVAGVVPDPSMYYAGIETIVADEWVEAGSGYFLVSFHYKPREPGLYTIVVWAENTLPYTHPYDPERFRDAVPVLDYTFEYRG